MDFLDEADETSADGMPGSPGVNSTSRTCVSLLAPEV